MKDPYFDLQAEIGISKHGGGWKASKQLAELCHISNDKYVLVVGSGTGASAHKLYKEYKCKMVGVDIHPRMVEEASKDYPEIKFQIADVQKLPFKDNTFDMVISESVTAFSPDKLKALKEYKRVVKPNGYIGLNEVTWVSKPSKELTDYVYTALGGVKPESKENWKKLLQKTGLNVIFAEQIKMKFFEQAIAESQVNGLTRNVKAFYKLFLYYLTRKDFRQASHKMVKDLWHMPKGLFKQFGYGLYVAQK